MTRIFLKSRPIVSSSLLVSVAVAVLANGCAKSKFGGGRTTKGGDNASAEDSLGKGDLPKVGVSSKGNPKAGEGGLGGQGVQQSTDSTSEGASADEDANTGVQGNADTGMGGTGMGGTGIDGAQPASEGTPGTIVEGSGSPDPDVMASATPAAAQATAAPGVAQLACATERGSGVSYARSATSKVTLADSCEKQTTITTTSSGKLPTDILFVLDVSNSMSGNLDTIKQNIVAFADGLTAKNWDVRYGAIGFVDEPLAAMQIGFSSAANFKSAFASWGVQRVCPGVDAKGREQDQTKVNCTTQEAGLKALRHAANVLESDAAAVPARAGFDKFVLYISDAYAWDTAFEDFNVNGVADVFKAKKAGKLPGLKFAHSVSEADALLSTIVSNPSYFKTPVRESDGLWYYVDKHIDPVDLHPVRTQMQALSGAMPSVPSSVLSYPFTQNVFLSQFSAAMTSTSHSATLQCQLSAAKVVNAQGAVVTTATASRTFDLSSIAAGTTGLKLVIDRCCKLPEGTACQETSSSTVPFSVTP
jgi:hypothetical protein